MADIDDVMRALGRIEGTLEANELRTKELIERQVRFEAAESASRATIHRRLDEQSKRISDLDKAIVVHSRMEEQTRDRLENLDGTISKNIMPSVQEYKNLKIVGWVFTSILISSGATLVGTIAYATEWTKATVRHWLNLS